MVDSAKSNNEQVRDALIVVEICKMTPGDIQKELATCCSHEVAKVIMEEFGDRQFSVLIDESRDISVKEQMAVMLRLVIVFSNLYYLALHHVKDTASEAIKNALYDILYILDRHTLSISRIRGHGYVGHQI